ncbi:MAG: hypothetical protein LUD81_06620 [Clostridiales bacterium]|nr:hypothetical protein [Clostridiales bacterium]
MSEYENTLNSFDLEDLDLCQGDSDAEFDKTSETRIVQNSVDDLGRLEILDNASQLSDFVKSEMGQNAVNKVSNILSAKATNLYDSSVRADYNFLERHGFINKDKLKIIDANKTKIGNAVNIGTQVVVNGGIYLAETVGNAMEKVNYKNFFLGWIGYINHCKCTPIMIANAKIILNAAKLNTNESEIKNIAESYINVSSSKIPHLSGSNFNMINGSNLAVLKSFAKTVITTCDLENSGAKQRALEFLEEGFKIPHNEAESFLRDTLAIQEFYGDIVGFSSLSYLAGYDDMINSVKDLVNFGVCNISMDMLTGRSEKNKKQLFSSGKKMMESKNNPITALKNLKISAAAGSLGKKGLVQNDVKGKAIVLNPKVDTKKGMEIMKKGFLYAKNIGYDK